MFKFIMGIIVGVLLYDMGPEFKQYFVESGSIDVAIEKLEDIKCTEEDYKKPYLCKWKFGYEDNLKLKMLLMKLQMLLLKTDLELLIIQQEK